MSPSSRTFLAVLMVAGLLSAGPGALSADDHDRLTTPQLIERAVERGEIDRAIGWLYLAYALSPNWERVPDRYDSLVRWDGTIPLLQLHRAVERMPRGPMRSQIEEVLHPGPGGVGADRCDISSAPMPNTMETAHFYIEYNPATIGGGLDVQDYAQSLETTWVTEIDAFGWAAPPVLPTNPAPNNKYHVRIDPSLGPAIYGFVSNVGVHAGNVGDNPNTAWTEPDAQASCMVHNANYEAFPGTTQNAMDATSAHEFDHSINFGYGALTGANDPDLNFSEGGATWKEDEVFDGSNDNYNYLWPDFEDDMGEHEGFEYSYWIVWRGMVERYGANVPGGSEQVMQNYWEITSRATGSVQLDAMNQALTAAGTNLPDAYHAFAVGIRFLRPCGGGYVYPYCFEEGPAYAAFEPELPPGPAIGPPPESGSIAAIGGSFEGEIPDNYALDWVALPTAGGAYDVTLSNTSAGGALRGTVACDTGTRLDLHAMPAVVGLAGVTNVAGFDPAGCTDAFAVITNQSQTAPDPNSSDDRTYTLSTSAASSQRTLSVSKVGTGHGDVTSAPAGIACGQSCSANFSQGQSVALTAAPALGSEFAGWSGACSGTGTCTVQMNSAKSVFAEFRSTGPFISEPRQAFQTSRSFTVAWGGGVGSYDVLVREAGAKSKFRPAGLWQAGITGTQATFDGRPGRTYCFSVGAIEAGTRATSFSDERCTAVPLDDKALRHQGRWKEKRRQGAYLGTVSRSGEKGAALVERGVEAERIAIIGTTCRRCGKVKVFLDGRRVGKAKLRAKRRASTQIIELPVLGSVREGTLRVVVASQGRKVQIEGIGISRV